MDGADQSGKAGRRGMAGGSLLALGIVGGVVIGTLYGQPSIGFLGGLGIGLLLFILVWLIDRRS